MILTKITKKKQLKEGKIVEEIRIKLITKTKNNCCRLVAYFVWLPTNCCTQRQQMTNKFISILLLTESTDILSASTLDV